MGECEKGKHFVNAKENQFNRIAFSPSFQTYCLDNEDAYFKGPLFDEENIYLVVKIEKCKPEDEIECADSAEIENYFNDNRLQFSVATNENFLDFKDDENPIH